MYEEYLINDLVRDGSGDICIFIFVWCLIWQNVSQSKLEKFMQPTVQMKHTIAYIFDKLKVNGLWL